MTLADIYFYTWDQLIANEIRRALAEANEACGGGVRVARRLNWEDSIVDYYLSLEPLPDLPGMHVFWLTAGDLERYSHKRVTVMTKQAIVRALRGEFASMRAVARFLSKNDKYLGGLMARGDVGD